MTHFTPIPALLGGLLIGGAAVLLLWLNGRIAGISGIAGGLLSPPVPGDSLWRGLFLLGLLIGSALYAALGGVHGAPRQGFPVPLLVAAGLLVGYGTAMAGGCTSGHGVCGLGRLSLRSAVAVLVFMGVAVATTFVTRHLLGVPA